MRIEIRPGVFENALLAINEDTMITIDFVTDEEKEHLPSRSFKLKPMEVCNALIAYHESVPSQDMIANAIPEPVSIFDGKNAILVLIEEIKLVFQTDKSFATLPEHDFVTGKDACESQEEKEANPIRESVFWYRDMKFGWKRYIKLRTYADRFYRPEGVSEFISHLKSQLNG